MKKIFLLGVVALLCGSLHAQEPESNKGAAQVSTTDALEYNRCSLSIISVGTNSALTEWVKNEDFGGKFDMNRIATTSISSEGDANKIKDVLNSKKIGKEILNYWLGYDGRVFSAALLAERASYNATDADILKDMASQVSTVKSLGTGKSLIPNSYVLVPCLKSLEQKQDKNGKVYFVAKVDAHVYRPALTYSIVNLVWNRWLQDDGIGSKEYIENKDFYDNLEVDMDFVASVSNKIGIGKTPEEAVMSTSASILSSLEKKIEKWQVITPVYKKRPLSAKIGKKENLKNSDRYCALKMVEDKNGNLITKKVGYVRATDIVDNRHDADGYSECSKFYQISGKTVREGMLLKQKNDIKLSVSASGMLGGYSPVSLDVDYLLHTTRVLGMMQYVGISMGFYTGKDTFGDNSMWVPITVNYSVGIHPVRILEITPNVGVGADYYGLPDSDSSEDSDSKFQKQLSYFARGGVKVGVQVWYPVQLFVRADYSYQFSKGEYYIDAKDKRFGKIGIGAGIKVNF